MGPIARMGARAANMNDPQKIFLFNLIGAFSAAALVLMLVYAAPGAVRGDLSAVQAFFKAHPGSEAFVIYAFPVVLILGAAWTWKVLRHFLRGRR